MMKGLQPRLRYACSLCGISNHQVSNCDDGYVCEKCSERTRDGRDATSRGLKHRQRSNALRLDQIQGSESGLSPDELNYQIAARELMAVAEIDACVPAPIGTGGEVIPSAHGGLIDTLTTPSVAAIEASNLRTELLTSLGNDIAAMALDTSDTIQAANSLEKMLAHQLASLHHAGMRMVHRANLQQDPVLASRTLGAAVKAFSTFQGGVAAIRQLRGVEKQHIVVQHVNVGQGGQAVVGTVNTGGGQSQ